MLTSTFSVFELDEAMVETNVLWNKYLTILELDEVMVGADVELPVFEQDKAMVWAYLELSVFELDEAMVRSDVELPVFELDEAMVDLMWSSQFLSLMKPWLYMIFLIQILILFLSLMKPWLELMWSSQFLRMMKPWSYCSLNWITYHLWAWLSHGWSWCGAPSSWEWWNHGAIVLWIE